jgi:hypothetical protein
MMEPLLRVLFFVDFNPAFDFAVILFCIPPLNEVVDTPLSGLNRRDF